MKKIIIIILLLIMPIVIYAQTCDTSKVTVKSIELESKNGSAEEVNAASISDGKLNLDLKLYEVNDSVNYNIKVKNESSEDVIVDKSLIKNSDYINYTISTSDNSNIIKAGNEQIIKLKVEYKNKVPSVKLEGNEFNDSKDIDLVLADKVENIVNPKTGNMITLYIIIALEMFIIMYIAVSKKVKFQQLSIFIVLLLIIPTIIYAECNYHVQINSKIAISEKEAVFDTGKNVNIKMKQLAGDDTSANGRKTINTNVTAIKKSQTEPTDANKTINNIVSSEFSYYPIYMWYDNGTIYWWSEDSTPSLNNDSKGMLSVFTELIDISGVETFNASRAKSIQSLLAGGDTVDITMKISNIEPLRNWDTSNVESFSYIFHMNTNLTDISVLSNWNTSSAKTMRATFQGAESIVSIDALRNWDVSKVTDICYMFNKASSISDVSALSNWKVSNVTTMKATFQTVPILSLEPFRNWDVSNVEDFGWLFGGNINKPFTSLEPLKDWNVSKAKKMDCMLSYLSVSSLTGIENWDVSNVTSMGGMFVEDKNITNLEPLRNWDVSKVENFGRGEGLSGGSGMFGSCTSLSDASAINDWNINREATFTKMFLNTTVKPTFSKVSGTWDSEGTFVPEE